MIGGEVADAVYTGMQINFDKQTQLCWNEKVIGLCDNLGYLTGSNNRPYA